MFKLKKVTSHFPAQLQQLIIFNQSKSHLVILNKKQIFGVVLVSFESFSTNCPAQTTQKVMSLSALQKNDFSLSSKYHFVTMLRYNPLHFCL